MTFRMPRFFLSPVLMLAFSMFHIDSVRAGVHLLPQIISEDLNGGKIKLPEGLSGERSLVLIGFSHEQRNEIRTWVAGMSLAGSKVPWLEMPVINDPGAVARLFIRTGMRSGMPDKNMGAHVVPVFVDKAGFLNALGIVDEKAVYAAVIDRQGRILMLVKGFYNADQARKIMKMLYPGRD